MMRLIPVLFCAALCLAGLGGGVLAEEADVAANLKPQRLRCEYRTEPLGVDQPRPELSWIVTSDSRGQIQSAYRVLAVLTPQMLESDKGDLWDTGKIEDNSTFGIVYAGADLKSHQQCFWKVMAWDCAGRPSGWSSGNMVHGTIESSGLAGSLDWL